MISVLYVDDEIFLLDATKKYLERGGKFSVDTATSAREGLAMIKAGHYNAVVSDYQMIGMDGVQFLKELRAAGNTVPFIIFTGKGREEVVIEAYRAGADAYLQKGGDPKPMFLDLMHAIEQSVSRRRMENDLKVRNALLATQQEVSPDGILVVGEEGKILSHNNRFLSMWNVPPEKAAAGEDTVLLDGIRGMVPNPDEFFERIRFLYEHRTETSHDEIRLIDGRTFDRYSAPMTGSDGRYYGRVWYFRDITEKKQAEAALLEGAEQYRTLIESANEAIFIIQEGAVVYTNPRGLALTGLSAEEIAHHSFLDFVHPEDRAEAMDRHRKRLANEPLDPRAQMRLVDRSGGVHWIEIDAVLIAWNRKPATLNFATEITKRKVAEQALQESETKYREIFNNVNDAIEIHEINADGLPGKYIEVNDIACRMLQYTREELLQKGPLDIVTGYHSIPLGELGKRFLDAGHAFFATEHRRKDGTILPVEVNALVVSIAGKRAVIAVTRDITERKKQEQAILKSEERFRFTIDATNDGIWDWDVPSGTAFFSPRWYTMLGYVPDEMPGSYATWRSLIHPDDLGLTEKVIQENLRKKGDGYSVEFRMRTKDGGWKWILSRGKVVGKDVKGNPSRIVGTHTDITAHKQADLALRQSLSEKELLLKEIHHRVKNNLQTISSLLYLQTLSTENQQEVAAIREARARVTSMGLIHQKLYQSADIATIPFLDYVQSLIEFLKESYGVDPDRVRIGIEVQPPDLSLDIDTGIPCGLIISELVTNALKYAFRGRAGGTIRIRIARDGEQYILSVSDDGIGLPADFDPANARTLGLTLVSGLVGQLDGTLDIGKGPGTTVNIRFSPKPFASPYSKEATDLQKTEIARRPMGN